MDRLSKEESGPPLREKAIFGLAYHQDLNILITYLKKNPQIKIEIQGHTDNIGEEKENQILS